MRKDVVEKTAEVTSQVKELLFQRSLGHSSQVPADPTSGHLLPIRTS